jgi:hypothetical protein
LEKRFGASARIEPAPAVLNAQVTVPLPPNPLGDWLNIALRLRENAGQTRLTRLRLGRLELPLDLDIRTLGEFLARLFTGEDISLFRAGFRELRFRHEQLILVYRWGPELVAGARNLVIDAAQRKTASLYYQALVGALGAGSRTLSGVLGSVFHEAERRSVARDPVAENRAALAALGLYAVGRDTAPLLPEIGTGARLPWVSLRGRVDLARHYLASSAIAATGDGDLSDLVGVYKEWSDSRGGSGFSFVDLAADRAGTRLGRLATTSPALARRVQASRSVAVLVIHFGTSKSPK